jgi:hypothetical protein
LKALAAFFVILRHLTVLFYTLLPVDYLGIVKSSKNLWQFVENTTLAKIAVNTAPKWTVPLTNEG